MASGAVNAKAAEIKADRWNLKILAIHLAVVNNTIIHGPSSVNASLLGFRTNKKMVERRVRASGIALPRRSAPA
jgi:hypothetical protein